MFGLCLQEQLHDFRHFNGEGVASPADRISWYLHFLICRIAERGL